MLDIFFWIKKISVQLSSIAEDVYYVLSNPSCPLAPLPNTPSHNVLGKTQRPLVNTYFLPSKNLSHKQTEISK